MKTGDTVFHRPSGETWTVAYADHAGGWMSWLGWPPGEAKISDCDLVEECTEAESMKLLEELARPSYDDYGKRTWRSIKCEAILFAKVQGFVAEGI
jgi:hypothetical protein